MKKKLRRMFELVERLRTGYFNVRGLSQELSISERQIYRDMGDLRQIGFNIRADPGTKNHRVFSDTTVPVKSLDFEETFFLLTVCNETGGNHPIPFHICKRPIARPSKFGTTCREVSASRWNLSERHSKSCVNHTMNGKKRKRFSMRSAVPIRKECRSVSVIRTRRIKTSKPF